MCDGVKLSQYFFFDYLFYVANELRTSYYRCDIDLNKFMRTACGCMSRCVNASVLFVSFFFVVSCFLSIFV